MHTVSIDPWRHDHVFLGRDHSRNERRTLFVIALTATMMVAEVIAGLAFGSMALLADGIHMATHAGALGVAAFAYAYARRHAHDERFTFGTGKVGDLAGYSSALILAVIAAVIAFESVVRLMSPVAIRFDEAIVVATVGLIVNLVSAALLHAGDGGGHEHGHSHGGAGHHHAGHAHHGGTHHHEDHNLRAAYFHVLTDALTSALAIVALFAGRFYGWVWMDPLMGIVGSVVIARWAMMLLKESGAVLVDARADPSMAARIREDLERGGDRVSDLHLWRVGPGHLALVVSIVSDRPQAPAAYRARLRDAATLSHVTIEAVLCDHAKAA
ncbi:CDF family Co(II)/Ni(II) efflux transporter DmeF [Acuticoccus mangrovi]|uniref:CDF family Co(II)/Ni(II) efflux transporter DmeF n=1 Tax=Acuticoccus mangrovi TaxID=2796142 RepID=A0A934IU37_9HYPH|nr:CDF family Co(II)/Ni(II) efflux transporter DmeF [Acuticoccus mangrovi]MBJ3778065.1 CDF family Co(II)/Ni(II) efflux transporter DmeF [Acuticoccus mangrovi]